MSRLRPYVIGLLSGCVLMFTVTSFAETIKQYLLVQPSYPIYVNDVAYETPDLPVLNYEGNTYIPLKAVGEMLGASVNWNDRLNRADIYYNAGEPTENSAYRNIHVTGTKGMYTITGEARVFEAVMSYAVSDGHDYLFTKFHNVNEGAPAWSAFTLNIEIPEKQHPINGTLMLELFEYSPKDGSKVNILSVPLESFKL